MTPYRVTLGAVARRQVTTIGEWWAANRDVPDLFARELREAISVLADAPYAQRRYQGQYRRLLLPRTRYHVYYRVDDQRRAVEVRAVWHAARGRDPRL